MDDGLPAITSIALLLHCRVAGLLVFGCLGIYDLNNVAVWTHVGGTTMVILSKTPKA